MKKPENDIEFITSVISQICDYAIDNGMNATDTLKTVANNILAICEIADFDEWKRGAEHG